MKKVTISNFNRPFEDIIQDIMILGDQVTKVNTSDETVDVVINNEDELDIIAQLIGSGFSYNLTSEVQLQNTLQELMEFIHDEQQYLITIKKL